MKRNISRVSIQIIALLILFGCASTEKEPIVQDDLFVEFGRDLAAANNKTKIDSPWLSGQAVKLNVVGPIYSSKGKQRSRANLILRETLDFLTSNSERMSIKTGIDLSQHFVDIERHDYSTDDDKFTYIPALVSNAFADEATLNAVIESSSMTRNSGNENAEIGFYLDEKSWKNKVILLSGYKSIKVEGKPRNTIWFRLRREMPEQSSVINVKNELASMVVFALNSSIREYASIDRGKVMLHSDYEFIVERSDGATYAYLYRDRQKMLDREKQKRIEALDKEKIILESSGVSYLETDHNQDKLLIIRNENFVSQLELVSIKNANQRSLLFQTNSWDEEIQQAFYFGAENTTVIVTDHRMIFQDSLTNKLIRSVDIEGRTGERTSGERAGVILADKTRQQVLLLNQSNVERYNLKGQKVGIIPLAGAVGNITLSHDSNILFYLNPEGIVSRYSLKTGQKEKVISLNSSLTALHQCKSGNQLLAYNDKTVTVIDTSGRQVVATHNYNDSTKSLDCNGSKNKLLVVFEDGSIKQFLLNDPSVEQVVFSMNYSGFDRQNSHYIGQYLSEDEFIYGGRDNLRIRSSVSEDEVRLSFSTMESKVSDSASWLDQFVIDQAVYVVSMPKKDKILYQNLFEKETPLNAINMKSFMVEEELDPILMSNQIQGFSGLGKNLTLSQDKGIRVVKELSTTNNEGLSASIPSLESLGYSVDVVKLGQYGFEARIYDSFSSTSFIDISTNILNVAITDSGEALMLMRSDGFLTLKQFDSGKSWSLPLSDNGIRAAAINKSHTLLATVSDRGILQVFDLTLHFSSELEPTITLLKEMKNYAGNISQIRFTSATHIMTSGKDQTIKVWDIESGEIVGTELLGHTDTITDSVYDVSMQKIISSSQDKTIRVWDPITHEQLFSFKGEGTPFVSAINAESNTVALINGNGIDVKNLITRDRVGRVAVSTPSDIQAIALGFESDVLYVAYSDRVEAKRVATGELVSVVAYPEPLQLNNMLIDPDYRNLVLIEKDDIHLINIGRFMLESLRFQQ